MRTILRKGSTVDKQSIKAAQSLLWLYGHLVDDIDGVFGSKTDAAVRAFQRRFGIHQDGVIGKNTWAKLLEGPIVELAGDKQPPDKPVKTNQYSEEVRSELEALWANMLITSSDRFEWAIRKSTQNQDVYREVASAVNPLMPWWFVAIIHGLESGFSFSLHVHNGDPLKARTVNVPKGRPVRGNPPFSWMESAIDALTMPGKAYDKAGDWSIPAILWRLEGYNGYGYRLYCGIHSPYLWAGTNFYSRGKYTEDGVYDANFVSDQPGAAGIAKLLGA